MTLLVCGICSFDPLFSLARVCSLLSRSPVVNRSYPYPWRRCSVLKHSVSSGAFSGSVHSWLSGSFALFFPYVLLHILHAWWVFSLFDRCFFHSWRPCPAWICAPRVSTFPFLSVGFPPLFFSRALCASPPPHVDYAATVNPVAVRLRCMRSAGEAVLVRPLVCEASAIGFFVPSFFSFTVFPTLPMGAGARPKRSHFFPWPFFFAGFLALRRYVFFTNRLAANFCYVFP